MVLEKIINWWTSDDVKRMLLRMQPSLGAAALVIATAELGSGEFGGNNRGPDVERYRAGVGGSGSWCAAFVYYCLEQAGKVPFKRTHGARKLFRRAVAAGMLVEEQDLLRGDLVLWGRGTGWQGHIGIVSDVVRNRSGKVLNWSYIAGNEGRYPSMVRLYRGKGRSRPVGFARI